MIIKDKRGFTLVELMIAMAMFAVVSSAILVFMVTGSRNYRRNKISSDIQKDAQLAIMQLTTLVQESMEVEKDGDNIIFYSPKTQSQILDDLTAASLPTTTPYPTDYRYGEEYAVMKKVVVYSSSKKALYYDEFSNKSHAVTGISGDDSKLMAENVDTFSVDVSKVDSSGLVVIDFRIKKEGQSFGDKFTVKLRNASKNVYASVSPSASATPEPTTTP